MLYIDNMLLNIIYIIFPMFCYLFFVAYKKGIGAKENSIIFEISLFSAIYLCLKYGQDYYIKEPIIIFNIPLLLAYIKDKKRSVITISAVLVLYYVFILSFNIYLVILEYFLYFIIFIFSRKKNYNNMIFINLFIIIKAFFLSFNYVYLINNSNSDINALINILICVIIFYFVAIFILELLRICEDIIDLNITMKKLEEEKQLRNSLFKITHEIKNPIAVCKGYLDMFDYNNPRHGQIYIPIIKQEINRTLALMEDFLDFSKITIEKNVLDINLLLDDVCGSLQFLFNAHNVKTNIAISEDEIYILGDYNRLKQVFINLLKNAVEAIAKDNNGTINLTSKTNNKYIVICIEDNGEGMDSEQLKRIEEPFYTTKKQGTGLGVSLSREIIKVHDGEIIFTSTKGIGTKVNICLPINY